MTRAQQIPHPWQELQKADGVEVTAINPLELGRPFQFTDNQRVALQPYLEAAGELGAVIILCHHRPDTNALQAWPIGLSQDDRRAISRTLTKRIRQQPR